MKEYSKQELTAEIAALEQVFDRVVLADPLQGAVLEPATMAPAGSAPLLPPLDETGRGMELVQNATMELLLCQAVTVEARPCVLCLYAATPMVQSDNLRERENLSRAVSQYQEDLRRDYVTNAYNDRYMNTECRRRAEKAAGEGRRVGAVMARVNEYAELAAEKTAAADCCLNTAAGILQLAVGIDAEKAVLGRLEDGLFLIVTLDGPAAAAERTVKEALDSARKEFNLSLSRRGRFTVDVASADWAETANWEQMLSLAEQRLGGC